MRIPKVVISGVVGGVGGHGRHGYDSQLAEQLC